MTVYGLTQEEAASRVGKKRSTVANALRLLRLPEAMRRALAEGALSAGHARALLSLENAAAADALFARILAEGLSVREAEQAAKETPAAPAPEGGAAGAGKAAEKETRGGNGKAKRDPDLEAAEQRFIDALGTKVSIRGGFERGEIVIDYFSRSDLDRIYALLGGH